MTLTEFEKRKLWATYQAIRCKDYEIIAKFKEKIWRDRDTIREGLQYVTDPKRIAAMRVLEQAMTKFLQSTYKEIREEYSTIFTDNIVIL